MSKKYAPSGYQIITLDLTGLNDGDIITPTDEDGKYIVDLLNGRIKHIKPILLTLLNFQDFTDICGFVNIASRNNTRLKLQVGDEDGGYTFTVKLEGESSLELGMSAI